MFTPIHFNKGLNVILGEIRDPRNRSRSTHGLGKTTLAHVIDFCLCRGLDKNFFLRKKRSLFDDFVFYLEIELIDASYVTVRRAVSQSSKLSFKQHETPRQRFSKESGLVWDHDNVGFNTGKLLLDGILGLSVIKPWGFRMPVSYALRTQQDFGDVFQLSKHVGKHRYWKPYVAHILGFDSNLVERGYDLEEVIEQKKKEIATLTLELRLEDVDLDFIRGLIEIKEVEVAELEKMIDGFDFEVQDTILNTKVVDELDTEIASLNEMKYFMTSKKRKILASLESEQIQFRPELAEKLFLEAGVVFADQIKKELNDLVKFNIEISNERIEYLREELIELTGRIRETAEKLAALHESRRSELSALGDIQFMSKYRHMTESLITHKNELFGLERQRDMLAEVQDRQSDIRKLVRKLEDQVELIQSDLNKNGKTPKGRYSKIRKELRRICSSFVGHKAIITTKLNEQGHLEFDAEYLDSANVATSEDSGKSFKQILCAAYDLAVATVLIDEPYIKFVYHDGLLEGLDSRIKWNVIDALHQISDVGVQQILTVIDSDLPVDDSGKNFLFDPDDVVLTLHDQGVKGRLFKHSTW